jgi:Terminase small subunit
MPALDNPRWEKFAQFRASGLPAYQAYLAAGYRCSDAVAMSRASELGRKGKVFARLRELNQELAEKMGVTRESLAREYDQIAQAAFAAGQFAAAKGAVEAKQGVLGLNPTSKSENVNLHGTFSQLTDEELHYEFASMLNEIRAAKGEPPRELPAKDEEKG